MPNRFVARTLLPTPRLPLGWHRCRTQGGTATVSGQVTDSTIAHTARRSGGLHRADVGGVPLRTARTNADGPLLDRAVAAGTFYGERADRRLRAEGAAHDDARRRDHHRGLRASQRTTQLDQVVVTGTGGVTQRRAVGNVIETIDAKTVLEVAPARSVDQLIGARTPGVIASQRAVRSARARRSASGREQPSLSNDPIIVIDGVRMDAGVARSGQRGGFGASRLNDISPEDIESIEVIKGPAAATLYGTEASNGVIQIITKRGGRNGAVRVHDPPGHELAAEPRRSRRHAVHAGTRRRADRLQPVPAREGKRQGPIFQTAATRATRAA